METAQLNIPTYVYGEQQNALLYADDFRMDDILHPIDLIKHKVFDMNEAWDFFINGVRGMGKSTVGLSLALVINPKLLSMTPQKALDKCWCFTVEEFRDKAKESKRGDVLCFDEQGTQKGGSSYKYRSIENQEYADDKQLDRTDGVINIGMSIDEGRVIKRVRELYKVDVYPGRKVSSEENNGNGMAIDCIVREVIQNPFAANDSQRFGKKYFNYTDGGRISRWRIPHPPDDIWMEYSRRRDAFKEELRDARENAESLRKSANSKESVFDKITRLQKQHG